MGIKSIRIKNLLSFDYVLINEIKDINCIIGQNNAGKSNLLSLINYFYDKLEGKQVIPPKFFSSYSTLGTISITFDTTRLRQVVTSKQDNPYLKHIYNVFFKDEPRKIVNMFSMMIPCIGRERDKQSLFELTLTINSDDSIGWSNDNKDVREILSRVFPFFAIETRRIDLY